MPSMTKVTSDRLTALTAIPYLRMLPTAELRRLAAQTVLRDVRRGAHVFDEGTPADGLYIVLEGRVRRVRTFAGLVEQLSLKDLTARTAGFLLAESRAAGRTTFELGATRDEIAARLGTVRELVSRSLARLRKTGAVRVAGRRVTIV